MFTRPEIAAALQDFVLVELLYRRHRPVPRPTRTWSFRSFHTVAIPFYAILDADEKVVANVAGSTSDAKEYLHFVQGPGAVGAGGGDWGVHGT